MILNEFLSFTFRLHLLHHKWNFLKYKTISYSLYFVPFYWRYSTILRISSLSYSLTFQPPYSLLECFLYRNPYLESSQLFLDHLLTGSFFPVILVSVLSSPVEILGQQFWQTDLNFHSHSFRTVVSTLLLHLGWTYHGRQSVFPNTYRISVTHKNSSHTV